MVCYYHTDKESTNTCETCGKEICQECSLEIAGKVYCKKCIENIIGLNLDKLNSKKENKIEESINERRKEGVVFKDSTTLINDDNPYKIVYNEKTYKSASEKVPEVKEFSSKPHIFKKYKINEESELKKSEFNEFEAISSTYNKEKEFFKKIDNTENSNESIKEEINITSLNTEKTFNETQDISSSQESNDYDIIYPDHSYEPPEISARRALEEKYENYLDDLYFDDEVPLNKQLAQDEEEFGSLTEKSYVPVEKKDIPLSELYPEEFGENGTYSDNIENKPIYEEPVQTPKRNAAAAGGIYATNEINHKDYEPVIHASSGIYAKKEVVEENQIPLTFKSEEELEAEIRRRLNSRKEAKKDKKIKSSLIGFLKKDYEKPNKNASKEESKIYNEIQKQKNKKEKVGVIDVLLTIVLIILVIVVLFYILYLFVLSSHYPTFTDAIFDLIINYL